MEEIWKDIEGYGGTFKVSNLGRIKTLNYRNTGKEKILKPKKHNRGYLQIQLMKGTRNNLYNSQVGCNEFYSEPRKLTIHKPQRRK